MKKEAKKDNKVLNRIEQNLQEKIEDLMRNNKVKFSVFLKVLRTDIPDNKSSDEYKNKHKAEYLKLLRASFSVKEIKDMLDVLGYDLKFTINSKVIEPKQYTLSDGIKVKYTELKAVCELLGIQDNWVKRSDGRVEPK